MKGTDTLTVSVKVKNTGSVAGKTAVQLYVRDKESTVRSPVRELRAFEKIALAPGEEKTVAFTLNQRAFTYWETKVHDWFVERGAFILEISESSHNIRVSAEIHVEGTRELLFTIDHNTPIAQLMKKPKGMAFVQQMMGGRSTCPGDAAQTSAMGEGSDAIMQQMMQETPLGSLVSYGRMTSAQLHALIAMLNA